MLCASPARAAHWVVTYQTSGTDTGTDKNTNLPYTTPWPTAGPNGSGGAPNGDISSAETSQGTVIPVLTWTLDSGETALPPAPDPAQAVIYVSINASIDGNNGRGTSPQHTSASDSFGDSFPTVTSGTMQTTRGAFCHLATMSNSGGSTQVSLPAITLNAACSTDGPNQGGSTTINVVAMPVNIVLAGVTAGGGQNNILVGQGCTGSWTPIQDGGGRVYGTLSNWQWTVSGNTFEDWEPTTPFIQRVQHANANASYFVPGYGPANQATANWYWSDLQQAPETVSCTATATPPPGLGAPFTVSSTQKVNVYVPGWTASGIGGSMHVNTGAPGQNGAIALWAGPGGGQLHGMNWTANCTTPQTPVAFGKGTVELVQIVTPNQSYETPPIPGVVHNDPENAREGLDTVCPYPGPNPAYVEGGLDYKTNDNPSLGLDATMISAAMQHQFTDWLMYQPPSAGNGVQWVALATFGWSTDGNASKGTGWADYTAQYGSDAAGTVSPSTYKPFMGITQANTFPSWTAINVFPSTPWPP